MLYCLCISCCLFLIFFFFSSRRRHTRLQGDWSSDVCSSDLGWLRAPEAPGWSAALVEIAGLSPSERSALADRARARAREHFGMEAMACKLERALVEAAEMGPVPTHAVLWFGSFVVVALFAYFMATMYAS